MSAELRIINYQDIIDSITPKALSHLKSNPFILAYSGGADSLSLALILKKLEFNFTAVIIDHKYRESSTEEAKSAQKILDNYDIKCHIIENNISSDFESNIEQKLRDIRYKLLTNFCVENNIKTLVTAHHGDDNIETFLMRLQRGSSISGLSAIKEISTLGKIKIVRPLLKTRKAQLLKFLEQNQITAIEDDSNKDEKFSRNKLRKILEEYSDDGVLFKRLTNNIKNFSRLDDYISSQVQEYFDNNIEILKEGVFIWKKSDYLASHQEINLRILKKIISIIGANDTKIRMDNLENLDQFISKNDNKSVTLSAVEILIKDEKIYFFKEFSKLNQLKLADDVARWNKNYQITYPQHLAKKYDILITSIGYDDLKSFLENSDTPTLPKKILRCLPKITILKCNSAIEISKFSPYITNNEIFREFKDIKIHFTLQL